MDKKSSSVINDVVGTFAAVSVVAYLLSLTLDESTPQPLAQSSATHQPAVSAVAYFSSDNLSVYAANNLANVDFDQLKDCKVIGVNQANAIVTLDCSKGHMKGGNNEHATQQI